ncbi:MAG: class I SAM-dependent methyltransferase [Clostridiaceae bacterium]
MEDAINTVKAYYDANPEAEWLRLDEHPFEFILTTHMMEPYIQPGDRVLDIGGGPGQYSIHFAKKGCAVTLVDLSGGNVAFAREKARQAGVALEAYEQNCLELDELNLGLFDHVFLMGPLYHLKEQASQKRAVEQALSCLKPGGKLYVTFIMAFAGILFDLKNGGNIVRDSTNPASRQLIDCIAAGGDYRGQAFTTVCFSHVRNILPFMEQFPLKRLHFFGQEGILAPNEKDILTRDREEIDCWIEIAKKYLELPELLCLSEHAMFIGEKIK